jgi:CHAD domain-containing protein
MADQLLSPEQISPLNELAANADPIALQRRAQILLLYNEGKDTSEIAERVGLSARSVQHWRREFLKRGMDIFPGVAIPEKTAPEASLEEPVEPRPTPETRAVSRKPAIKKTRYPRVRKKTGIKADDSMAEAGRKILRFHFARMLSHENGARLGENIEELHDMRVATRRMRAAFEVFDSFFQPKVVKVHLKGLRATGRALGRVRDLDVFMEKAQHYLDTLPEDERPGLSPLLNTWRQERSVDREKMLAYLDSKGYRQFNETFNEFVTTPGAGVRSRSKNKAGPDLVCHVAPVLIYTRLAAVRAYEAVVPNAAIEQLHALRIDFKKLRYTVEYFREVLGEGAREVIDDIKTLQDHLGNLNDADVACRILREFIESWEEHQIDLPLHERKNPEPVVAYLAAKHAERHHLMVTFPEAWAHFSRSGFLKQVALAVSVL